MWCPAAAGPPHQCSQVGRLHRPPPACMPGRLRGMRAGGQRGHRHPLTPLPLMTGMCSCVIATADVACPQSQQCVCVCATLLLTQLACHMKSLHSGGNQTQVTVAMLHHTTRVPPVQHAMPSHAMPCHAMQNMQSAAVPSPRHAMPCPPRAHWHSFQPGGLDSAQKMGMSLSRSHSHLRGSRTQERMGSGLSRPDRHGRCPTRCRRPWQHAAGQCSHSACSCLLGSAGHGDLDRGRLICDITWAMARGCCLLTCW